MEGTFLGSLLHSSVETQDYADLMSFATHGKSRNMNKTAKDTNTMTIGETFACCQTPVPINVHHVYRIPIDHTA